MPAPDGDYQDAIQLAKGEETQTVIDGPIAGLIADGWQPIQRWERSLSGGVVNSGWNPKLKTWVANRKPILPTQEDYSTVLNDTTEVIEPVLKVMLKYPVATTQHSKRHKAANDLRLDAIKEVWLQHLALRGVNGLDYARLAKCCSCTETEIKKLDKHWRKVHDIPQQQRKSGVRTRAATAAKLMGR